MWSSRARNVVHCASVAALCAAYRFSACSDTVQYDVSSATSPSARAVVTVCATQLYGTAWSNLEWIHDVGASPAPIACGRYSHPDAPNPAWTFDDATDRSSPLK